MYNDLFAANYDKLTANFSHKKAAHFIEKQIKRHCKTSKKDRLTLLDVGCGTGKMAKLLTRKGHQLIAADPSADMLAVAQQRLFGTDILFLNQSAEQLDLYGTVDAAYSTLDVLSHIITEEKFAQAIARIALFIEAGGLFIFDVNTIYKHKHVLNNGNFAYKSAEWKVILKENNTIKNTISINKEQTEIIEERAYSEEQIRELLEQANLKVISTHDGYSKKEPSEKTERLVFVTQKVESNSNGKE